MRCDFGKEFIMLLYPPALCYAYPHARGNAKKNIKNWNTSVNATARIPPKVDYKVKIPTPIKIPSI